MADVILTRCIVRAYRGAPLDRHLVEVTRGKAYVFNLDGAHPEEVEFAGVGFPYCDVFEYAPETMDALIAAARNGEDALRSAWELATPLPL